MEEEWKWSIEGHYEISNFGNFRSVDRQSISYGTRMCERKGKVRKIHYVPNRYAMVDVCIEGKRTTYTIHRLVALAFIPNPDNLPQVDHIDQDKHNNHVSNLRWSSHSDNQQNRANTTWSRLGEKYIRLRPNCKKVFLFTKTINGVKTERVFKSLDEAKAFRLQLLGF